MADDHQLAVIVVPDLMRAGRYRWTIFHSGQSQDRSEFSFATEGEAQAEGAKALKKRIDEWKARSRSWGD